MGQSSLLRLRCSGNYFSTVGDELAETEVCSTAGTNASACAAVI